MDRVRKKFQMNFLIEEYKNSKLIEERDTVALIRQYYPRFEIFEEKFLDQIKDPKSGQWLDVEYLEEIGLSQWGVLKSINYINIVRNKVYPGDSYLRFKNVYFHFGLIADTVAYLARNICFLEEKLGICINSVHEQKTKNELIQDFTKYIENHYDKNYQNYCRDNRPIVYHINSKVDHIRALVTDESLLKNYNQFFQLVSFYRNYFIHNPSFDIIHTDGREVAVKKESLKNNTNEIQDKFRHWSRIREDLSEKETLKLFTCAKDMIYDDLIEMLKLLNVIWEQFIVRLEQIYKHEDFKSKIMDEKLLT
jgi:hypothetical protein